MIQLEFAALSETFGADQNFNPPAGWDPDDSYNSDEDAPLRDHYAPRQVTHSPQCKHSDDDAPLRVRSRSVPCLYPGS